MAIRIERNEAGNCINFHGTTNPTYWNACLSGEVNELDTNTVNVINDIVTAQTGIEHYEFYQVPFTEFVDADGNGFASAQDTADYITLKANVIGNEGAGIDAIGQTICFDLDDTNTSIMLDNGFSFGVNTIKAVPDADGTIHIKSKTGDITHFYHLEVGNVCVNGEVIAGGLNDIANTLNELFTVGAFTSVVISDPFSTMVADVNGVDIVNPAYVGNSIDPVGDDVFASTVNGNLNGYKSTEKIDQAGEYFTFDIRVEGQIGFGLIHSQASYDNGHYSGSATYADPTTFGTGNSAHYGFQFSHWFHPTPNGSWTNYGANTSYVMGSGWSNWESKDNWLAGDPVKIKVGLDENGYIAISSLQDDGVTWVLHARTAYAVPEGAEFHLGIKMGYTTPRVYSLPKVHLLEPAAPTMNFRYIESPDGVFQYPIFLTEEEANYYDSQNGGTGESNIEVFADEPTFTNWYTPVNGFVNNGTSAPSFDLTLGQPATYTEITSLSNADLAPVAFTDTTITVDELSAVNYQLSPVDAGYVTTIGSVNGFSIVGGTTLEGTAPEVTGDYVANPSDTLDITVYRANAYGSTSGTLTLNITNLTAPITAISGFHHISGSTAMIDSDTMDDGSVVRTNSGLLDGERFIIEKAYVEANILPSLQGVGDKYIVGLTNSGADFSTLELTDFDSAIIWEYESATSHTFKFYRDGSVVQNIVIGSMTNAIYDYAIEIDGTSAWLIACNINSIMNEPSPSEGGQFSHTYEVTNFDSQSHDYIHMAVQNTTGDISTTGIETIDTPAASTMVTSWNKALDFSGSSERAEQVNSGYTTAPLKMGGTNNQVAAPTAGQTVSSGHPWATAIVFNADGHSSNQHIWNLGEGAGSTDDNIYLRLSATRQLYFGWGRDGDLNECYLGMISSNSWFGLYIAHNGTRYGSGSTSNQVADAFDIRFVTLSSGQVQSNVSTASNWISTGRMNREYQGDMTIGGRGANRSFHGKVASMVVTTLKCGVAMPDSTEIQLMVTDPMKWMQDYKEGQTFRQSLHTATTTDWDSSVGTTKAFATQIWLMGDGVNDSYSNMIRNQVFANDQNYTKLNLISMVSNDIQNVTIGGLS